MSEARNDGRTPLMVACQRGALEHVKLLLHEGVDTEAKDNMGRTALHYCSEDKHTEVAALLLGTAPNLLEQADSEGHTAVHMATLAQNVPLLLLLLDLGAEIDGQDDKKHTAVHWATVCGHLEVLRTLLERGAQADIPDELGAYPIHYAAQLCGTEGKDSENMTGVQVLKELIQRDVCIDSKDSVRRQPLLWAASSGSRTACRLLVEAGANVEAGDKDGLRAIHCAASKGNEECLLELLDECEADINSTDTYQCSALFYALSYGHCKSAQLLIERGADLCAVDAKGRSPAHCAAQAGDLVSLQTIQSHGGSLWLRSKKLEYPIHEASLAGHADVVTFIAKTKLSSHDLNATNQDGRTCMHLAAIYGKLLVLKALFDAGAKINVVMPHKVKSPAFKDQYISPYDAAVIKKHKTCAQYLEYQGAATASEIREAAARTIQRYARNTILSKAKQTSNECKESTTDNESGTKVEEKEENEHKDDISIGSDRSSLKGEEPFEKPKEEMFIRPKSSPEPREFRTNHVRPKSCQERKTARPENDLDLDPESNVGRKPKVWRKRSGRMRKPHPVQESVVRYETIKFCSSERHRLRRCLLRDPTPLSEAAVINGRIETFFNNFQHSRRPNSNCRDFDDWESFLSEQLRKLDEDEDRVTRKSPRPIADSCRGNVSSSKDAVSNDPEMSRLVASTEEQMSRNRTRCSSSISAYRERNQRMSNNLSSKSANSSAYNPPRDANRVLNPRKNKQMQLLAKAYYPLKLPLEVYYKDLPTPRTGRPQTGRGDRLSGVAVNTEPPKSRAMSAAQYRSSKRTSFHNRQDSNQLPFLGGRATSAY